jgi:hypothetical protein
MRSSYRCPSLPLRTIVTVDGVVSLYEVALLAVNFVVFLAVNCVNRSLCPTVRAL